MKRISDVLGMDVDNDGGKYLWFMCPGCDEMHMIKVEGSGRPCWSWNGSAEKPTFAPSILVRSGHYVPGQEGQPCWCDFDQRFPERAPSRYKCGVCHSFVTDGRIQFLGDCTHELAGQTVDLPALPGDAPC